MSRFPIPAVLLAVCLGAQSGRADEPPKRRFSFSGFGTVGMVHSSEKNADFTSSNLKPHGAGHTHGWSGEVDSLLAAQMAIRLAPKLSVVTQMISEQRYDGTYWPRVEWANASYGFTPDFTVRLGRTILPVFMVTDSRKVSYANLWVRPPLEVYSLVPITSNDGLDATYRLRFGATTHTLQLTAGRSNSKFSGDRDAITTVEARRVISFADTVERNAWTARLAYGRTNVTIPQFRPLFDGFRAFGPTGVEIADRYDVAQSLVTFVGAGVGYDHGRLVASAEWGHVATDSALGNTSGWYVSAGYRLSEALTLYGSYARNKGDDRISDPGLSVAGLPPASAAAAAGLNSALNALLSTKVAQGTVSLGSRFELGRIAAFKIQFDRTQHAKGSAGALINLQPGFVPGGKVNVFTATIDVVF